MDLTEDIQPTTTTIVYIGGSSDHKVEFTAGNKAKMSLRNRAIEWESFKEHVSKATAEEKEKAIRDFTVRFFNMQATEQPVGELLSEYASKDLTALIQHVRKQIFLHEPLAWSIREVFFKLVRMYEELLQKLLPPDEWSVFATKWEQHNPEDTSSKPLWNLTRDKTFSEAIVAKHPQLAGWVAECNASFQYKGFCPKVPSIRLGILLDFPVWNLVRTMDWHEDEQKLNTLSKAICDLLRDSKPFDTRSLVSGCVRMDPPKQTDDPIKVIDTIISYEFKLLPALEALESHYLDKAKLFNEIVLVI